ncbi:hypothetical protein DL96DRAFT_857311 [Flagelloscypha sp. PMI_526]|nr:hypothetical protein DL96DRAFT_857311 [Flagelloscypha sp. PMI_526]
MFRRREFCKATGSTVRVVDVAGTSFSPCSCPWCFPGPLQNRIHLALHHYSHSQAKSMPLLLQRVFVPRVFVIWICVLSMYSLFHQCIDSTCTWRPKPKMPPLLARHLLVIGCPPSTNMRSVAFFSHIYLSLRCFKKKDTWLIGGK